MKKIIISFFILISIINTYSLADDTFDLEEIEEIPSSEVSSDSTSEPITYSKNIIVIDRKTLLPLYEKNAYEKVAMASTTKIMTCIIALENSSLDEIVTISKNSATVTGSTLGLSSNMQISMNDLLYGLMLRSGNDCAVAIAEDISGSIENFAELMNKKAQELNLKNTNFVTPHGLDDSNHYTTAFDLAILTNYALNNEKFKEIVSSKNYTISFNGYPKTISNTNELLGNVSGVYGVKTGFTFGAGRCLVSSCKRNNLDIIIVVLGANTKKIRTTDSSKLINYIFNTYKYVDISSVINDSFEKFNSYFNQNYILEKTTTKPILKLENLDNYYFPLSQNEILELSSKTYFNNKFNSNITKGSKIGEIYLYKNNTQICSVGILLDNELIKNDWKYYFKYILANFKNFYIK